MGNIFSKENYDTTALHFYTILQHEPHLLPDVGIDESLLKYSGSDSNAALQAYSDEMLNMDSVPGYISSLGAAIGALTPVPNAVGLGALVISMIIEIIIKSSTQTSDKTDTYSLLRRVFGEEKASSVRDTMSEYLKRHEVYMNNTERLREEIKRLEQELSNHLTILRNSLLHDGQMSSRGLKIWVNGAAFHVQMLIHEARLGVQAGKPASDCVREIEAAINVYSRDLDPLLEQYKTYMLDSKMFTPHSIHIGIDFSVSYSYLRNKENDKHSKIDISNFYRGPEVMTALTNLVYSKYEPISGLKSYFLNIKTDLNSLIHESGSFTVPSAEG